MDPIMMNLNFRVSLCVESCMLGFCSAVYKRMDDSRKILILFIEWNESLLMELRMKIQNTKSS